VISKLISNLYDLTDTPRSKREFKSEALSLSLDALQSCDTRKAHYQDFSDQEISDFVWFILLFLDMPSNLRGILHINRFIHILMAAFYEPATDSDLVRDQAQALLKRWLHYLALSTPTDLAILTNKPLIKDSPLLFFHYTAYSDSLLPDGTCPFYQAYGHKFHRVIREFKRKNPLLGRYEATVRAARYFFDYMSPEILALPTHPANMPKKYITIFLENLKKNVKSTDIAGLMSFYNRLFKQLLRRDPLKKRKGSRGGNKHKKSTSNAADNYLSPDIVEVVMEPESEDDIDLTPADFLHTNPTEKVVAQKPNLCRSSLDAISCRYRRFWWDKDCLKVDELHAIYAASTTYWGYSDLHDLVIIYLQLLIHYGWDADKLLHLSCSPGFHTPGFTKIGDQLFLVTDPPIIREDDTYTGCLEPGKSVYLPVPRKLQRLIEPKLKASGTFFQYITDAGITIDLSAYQIVQFIDKFVNSTGGFRVSISRIQASFPVLYSGRFGLDPIHCCYVSGTVVHRLYRSQLHYIFCDARTLSIEHFKTYQKIDSHIISSLYSAKEREHLSSTKPDNYKLFFEADNSCPPADLPFAAYGSPKVPPLEGVRTVLETIKKKLDNSESVVVRHNLYVCYEYLCLQFATGMRPRNEPDEQCIDYIAEREMIILADKQSPLYQERRVIVLPKTAATIISRFMSNFSKLKTVVVSNINSIFINVTDGRLFFFLDESGNFIDFTLKGFRACLLSAGIDYPFPDNSPRHYLKTYLHGKGITMAVSDAWTGHTHASHEDLNSASSLIPAESIRGCREIIDNMLVELGFTDIPYLR